MSLLRPMDPAFPIERQLTIEAGPVVLLNVFTLDEPDEQTFLRAWKDDADVMKRLPGFIATQLHRAELERRHRVEASVRGEPSRSGAQLCLPAEEHGALHPARCSSS